MKSTNNLVIPQEILDAFDVEKKEPPKLKPIVIERKIRPAVNREQAQNWRAVFTTHALKMRKERVPEAGVHQMYKDLLESFFNMFYLPPNNKIIIRGALADYIMSPDGCVVSIFSKGWAAYANLSVVEERKSELLKKMKNYYLTKQKIANYEKKWQTLIS